MILGRRKSRSSPNLDRKDESGACSRDGRSPGGFDLLMGIGREGPRGRNRYSVAAVLGLAAVFIVDLLTPLGVADGMLYAPVVLLGLWRSESAFIFPSRAPARP